MTALLTGREISDVTRMTDMRRCYHRRKGEINGPFSWGSIIDFFTWAVILAALFYVCFLTGRWYESAQKADTVHPATIANQYKSFRVSSH